MSVAADGAVEGNILSRLHTVLILESLHVLRNHQVSLAGGKGIGLQFLSEDVHLYSLAPFLGNLQYAILCDCEDAARAACSVVYMIGVVGYLVGNRQYSKVGQQFHVVARREVLTSLSHVVFLVELAQQFFEDGAHRVVIETWQTDVAVVILHGFIGEVDLVVRKLLDDAA